MDLYMRMIFVWVGSTNSIEPGFKLIHRAVGWVLVILGHPSHQHLYHSSSSHISLSQSS